MGNCTRVDDKSGVVSMHKCGSPRLCGHGVVSFLPPFRLLDDLKSVFKLSNGLLTSLLFMRVGGCPRQCQPSFVRQAPHL